MPTATSQDALDMVDDMFAAALDTDAPEKPDDYEDDGGVFDECVRRPAQCTARFPWDSLPVRT